MTSAARSRFAIGTFTISLCASLAVHAALFVGGAYYFVRSIGRIHLDAYPRVQRANEPAPAFVMLPRGVKFDEQLGRQDGTGNAADDADGAEPLQASKAEQSQAFLSRDPAGAGPMHTTPSPSPLPAGGSAGAKNSSNAPAEVEQREIPFGVSAINGGPQPEGEPVPKPKSQAASESAAKPSQEAAASESAAPAPSPGVAVAPADPAPQAETESDPFAVEGSAQFRPGSTRAQLGRKHRLVAPRIGMAGIMDGQQLGTVKLVLQLTIDPSGNVRRAKIFQSSGSENIDQACRVAAYQWWFEPKKELAAKSKEETFLFVITFA